MGECIESVLTQTLGNFELILVDDGSTDGSDAALTAFLRKDPRVRILSQPQQGVSVARNVGMKGARGIFVYLLDSDDLVHPQLLERSVGALNADSTTDFVRFGYVPFPEEVSGMGQKFWGLRAEECLKRARWAVPILDFLAEEDFHLPVVWRWVYRRSAIGNLRFVPGQRYEDIVFTWRFLKKARAGLSLPIPLHAYRLRQARSPTAG